MFIVCLLPPDQTIRRKHLVALESYVDYHLIETDRDEENLYGRIIGEKVGRDDGTVQKLRRLSMSNFRCDTYERLLNNALRANVELMQAVRPFALKEGDGQIIEQIRRLNDIHHAQLTANGD